MLEMEDKGSARLTSAIFSSSLPALSSWMMSRHIPDIESAA